MYITFYPVGNGDSILLKTNDGRLLLFDYKNCEHVDNKCINLSEELQELLDDENQKEFDVVTFTHADQDHYAGFSKFFYLRHAQKYQSSERIEIKELWVPAKVLTETSLKEEGRILKAEALYRFLAEKKGIIVFGNSGDIDDLLAERGISPDEVKNLRVSAGESISSFSADKGGVEFFVHSPHSWVTDDAKEKRNNPSIILQLQFYMHGIPVARCILGGDAEYPAWINIYNSSDNNNNLEKLDWNLFKVSHHCSYGSLSDVKGTEITTPKDEIDKIFQRGSDGCYLISSSKPIPSTVSDGEYPPHKPAANYYKKIAKEKGGEFFVTMEHPKEDDPKPISFEVTQDGFNKKDTSITETPYLSTKRTPRFGT